MAKSKQDKNKKISESMKHNNNAEEWTFDASLEFMQKCYGLCSRKTEYIVHGKKVTGYEFHFIGEIVAELEQYSDLLLYLKKKYTALEGVYSRIKTRLESNCFSDSKKGIIKEATAIMNLKSNYGWTDRNTNENNNTNYNHNVELSKEEMKILNDQLENEC